MTLLRKRNGFGGHNRGQRTSHAAATEYRLAKRRAQVLEYLRLQYRGDPLELFWSADHVRGPRWVARYPSVVSFAPQGAITAARFRECVIRKNRVEEID
jgi:hypothetical protein